MSRFLDSFSRVSFVSLIAFVATVAYVHASSTCDSSGTCDTGSDSMSLLQPHPVSTLSERWETRQTSGKEMGVARLGEEKATGSVTHLGETTAWKTSGKFDVGMAFPKASPMPLMMRAVLALVMMNFVMHVFRSVTASYNILFDGAAPRLAAALEAVTGPAVYTPMLCTLFLAPWFRGMRLTGSLDPLLFELPQAWLEVVTIICSAAIVVKTLIHFAASYLGVGAESKDGKGSNARLPASLRSMSQGSHLLTNATVACVILGTIFMEARYDPGEEAKRMSTSTANIMLLGSQYFTLHIVDHFRAITATDSDIETTDSAVQWQVAMDMTKMVPMLCLLFQAAGMHALEQDPPAGQPPVAIRTAMDVASYALFAAISIQVLPWLLPSVAAMCSGGRGMVLASVRFILRLVVFLAAFCVCGSVWADPRLHHVKKSKDAFDSWQDDPFDPFDMGIFASDMVLSVILIATLFLGAHLVSWIAELFGDTPRTRRISAGVFSSLDICPTVAVLIVVLRLRSLQLSAGLGEPEARVEMCMYLVFLGLLGRLFCGMVGAAVTKAEDVDNPEEVPEADRSEHRGVCGSCMTGVIRPMQLLCTLLVYVSIAVMLVGVIYMGKDNMQELKRPFGQFAHPKGVAKA